MRISVDAWHAGHDFLLILCQGGFLLLDVFFDCFEYSPPFREGTAPRVAALPQLLGAQWPGPKLQHSTGLFETRIGTGLANSCR